MEGTAIILVLLQGTEMLNNSSIVTELISTEMYFKSMNLASVSMLLISLQDGNTEMLFSFNY